jgi:hypothetical protein
MLGRAINMIFNLKYDNSNYSVIVKDTVKFIYFNYLNYVIAMFYEPKYFLTDLIMMFFSL